jgi:uncharacterized protein (DUF1810 family)
VTDDPFALQRFVDAQAGGVHERAVAELRAGAKHGHWMWFVFPQLRGLGSSPTAQRYALGGLDEAQALLAHPLLGPRLLECCDALLAGAPAGGSAAAVLGPVDALKLRSSMTLFDRADPAQPRFAAVLARFYDGVGDATTVRLLAR